MKITNELHEAHKDVRQATRMAKSVKALRKKARKGAMTKEQEQAFARAQRYLEDHPVTLQGDSQLS